MADHRLALLLEQRDKPLLLFNQGVYFGGFLVKEV